MKTRNAFKIMLSVIMIGLFILIMLPTIGEARSVIEINNVVDFARIGRHNSFPLNGHYVLTADINLNDLATMPVNQVPTTGLLSTTQNNNRAFHQQRGWLGIGSTATSPAPATDKEAFTGVLDGNGHTISGLWMNRTAVAAQMGISQGLFRTLRSAQVRDLTIELDSRGITGDGERRGALAGNIYESQIENVHIIGNGATIGADKCLSKYHGGLTGKLRNSIVTNVSVENVDITGYAYLGGIAGAVYNQTNSKGTTQFANIENTTATNISIRARGAYAGGFAGVIYHQTTVSNSHVVGTRVNATKSYVGGFAGSVGHGSRVNDSSVTGDISITSGQEHVGGFAGAVYGNGLNSKGLPSVLCGTSVGTADNFAQVNARSFAGGFTGVLSGKSTISESNSYANVHVRDAYVGGFVGSLDEGVITNAYAHGELTVTSTTRQNAYQGGVGGFAGNIDKICCSKTGVQTIRNAYANVSFKLPANRNQNTLGGFLGDQGSTRLSFDNHHSFFNAETANFTRNAGTILNGNLTNTSRFVSGITSAQMQDQSTFINWDFENVWTMQGSLHGYPVFSNGATCGGGGPVACPIIPSPTVVVDVEEPTGNIGFDINVEYQIVDGAGELISLENDGEVATIVIQPNECTSFTKDTAVVVNTPDSWQLVGYSIDGDGNLVVTVRPIYYTVTFRRNDSSAGNQDIHASVEVRHGHSVAQPVDPIHDTWLFQGWFTANAGGMNFDFGAPITANTEVFAQWENPAAPGIMHVTLTVAPIADNQVMLWVGVTPPGVEVEVSGNIITLTPPASEFFDPNITVELTIDDFMALGNINPASPYSWEFTPNGEIVITVNFL